MLVCCGCIGSCLSVLHAADPEPTFEELGVSSYRFDWTGEAGLTYFVQYSQDLQNWQYFPLIDHGVVHDAVDVTPLDASNKPLAKFFMRLVYTDIPTTDAEADDFDYDGISNLLELSSGSDPLDATSKGIDSDNDGLPDPWEMHYFGNLLSTASADTDTDGFSNIEEYQAGLDPQQNEFNNTAKHTAFQYDPVGRLEQVSSPTASENIVPDDEGNITTAN